MKRMDYKKAGVDIEAGYKAVSLMKEHIASTMRPEVLTDIGGFSVFHETLYGNGGTDSCFRYGRCWNEAETCIFDG